MTSALTMLSLDDYISDTPAVSQMQESGDAMFQVWRLYSGTAYNTLQVQSSDYVIRACPGTAPYEVNIVQYGESSSSWVIIDFQEPTSEFPEEHQGVIDYLRDYGRPLLADKLVEMLRNVEEDSDEPMPKIVSLRDMARYLVEHRNFAEPFIGPDSSGLVHAQWRIMDDGVLVVIFFGYGEILLVAQADRARDGKELDISIRGDGHTILEEHGYLVPRR